MKTSNPTKILSIPKSSSPSYKNLKMIPKPSKQKSIKIATSVNFNHIRRPSHELSSKDSKQLYNSMTVKSKSSNSEPKQNKNRGSSKTPLEKRNTIDNFFKTPKDLKGSVDKFKLLNAVKGTSMTARKTQTPNKVLPKILSLYNN